MSSCGATVLYQWEWKNLATPKTNIEGAFGHFQSMA